VLFLSSNSRTSAVYFVIKFMATIFSCYCGLFFLKFFLQAVFLMRLLEFCPQILGLLFLKRVWHIFVLKFTDHCFSWLCGLFCPHNFLRTLFLTWESRILYLIIFLWPTVFLISVAYFCPQIHGPLFLMFVRSILSS
jgi:hypothetical protein